MGIESFLMPSGKRILFTIIVSAIILSSFILYLGVFPFIVNFESGSMEPSIGRNSLNFVQATTFEGINVGDVILVSPSAGSTMLAHRVISIDSVNRVFDTRGDANTGQMAIEKNITADKIRGKIVASVPLIGMLGGLNYIIGILLIYLVSCLIFRAPRPNSAASPPKQ
jgi:signal peptidase